MTQLTTQPQPMAAATAELAGIGTAISEVRALAAGPTVGRAAAAADEVSAVSQRRGYPASDAWAAGGTRRWANSRAH